MNNACRCIEEEKKLHPAPVFHGITIHMWQHCGPNFTNSLFRPIFRAHFPRYYKCMFFRLFFRVQLGWDNTYSMISLILSLNPLWFLIFVLFSLEEEENLKKNKKTFEEKIMRFLLPNLFNLLPFCISFF